MNNFKQGQAVHDSWWPLRSGHVRNVLKTRLRVEWSDGEVWTYDQSHMQFLRKDTP